MVESQLPIAEARLIGEVAYLKFNAFMGNDERAPAARSFLLASEGTIKAVVIDCRDKRGGSPEMMDTILPLLYAHPATLMRSHMRADPWGPTLVPGGPIAVRTLVRREVPSNLIRHDRMVTPDTERRLLQTVPVVYLTSKRTASGAEHLALRCDRGQWRTFLRLHPRRAQLRSGHGPGSGRQRRHPGCFCASRTGPGDGLAAGS